MAAGFRPSAGEVPFLFHEPSLQPALWQVLLVSLDWRRCVGRGPGTICVPAEPAPAPALPSPVAGVGSRFAPSALDGLREGLWVAPFNTFQMPPRSVL